MPLDVRTEQRTAAEPGGRWAGTLVHGSLDTRLRHRISLTRNARRPRPRALHALRMWFRSCFLSQCQPEVVLPTATGHQDSCPCVVAVGRCFARSLLCQIAALPDPWLADTGTRDCSRVVYLR